MLLLSTPPKRIHANAVCAIAFHSLYIRTARTLIDYLRPLRKQIDHNEFDTMTAQYGRNAWVVCFGNLTKGMRCSVKRTWKSFSSPFSRSIDQM